MKIVKKQIELKDETFVGPIVDLLSVRVENGKVYGYFELDEGIKNTKVSIKFVKTGIDYPVGEFTGYEYFKTINIYDNEMFSNAFFALGGASDGEYHIYRNINYSCLDILDEFLKKSEKKEEKSDPVPEGAELFTKAQVASGKGATFTAKNCMIDPEILKQLFM
jgi:hypothetical protein